VTNLGLGSPATRRTLRPISSASFNDISNDSSNEAAFYFQDLTDKDSACPL
jgi:hypothetical protein